jgi:hypothetical protein
VQPKAPVARLQPRGGRRRSFVGVGGRAHVLDQIVDRHRAARRVVVRTPEEKIASAAKAKATRAARHTLGKLQKAEIKGTVPSTSTSTPTAPAPRARSPTTAPAPSHQS